MAGAVTLEITECLFTPQGQKAREQEVHRARLFVMDAEGGAQRLAFSVQTTRPGETRDDRGVQGWDMPAEIEVTTDPIDLSTLTPEVMVIENAIQSPKQFERALFYWDHADFETVHLSLSGTPSRFSVTFEGTSTAGHHIRFHGHASG